MIGRNFVMKMSLPFMVIVLVFSVAVSPLLSSEVFAKKTSGMNVEEQILSFLAYSSIEHCLKERISQADFNSGDPEKIFTKNIQYGGSGTSASSYGGGTKTEVVNGYNNLECPDLISEAIYGPWGYGSIQKALEDWGYKYVQQIDVPWATDPTHQYIIPKTNASYTENGTKIHTDYVENLAGVKVRVKEKIKSHVGGNIDILNKSKANVAWSYYYGLLNTCIGGFSGAKPINEAESGQKSAAIKNTDSGIPSGGGFIKYTFIDQEKDNQKVDMITYVNENKQIFTGVGTTRLSCTSIAKKTSEYASGVRSSTDSKKSEISKMYKNALNAVLNTHCSSGLPDDISKCKEDAISKIEPCVISADNALGEKLGNGGSVTDKDKFLNDAFARCYSNATKIPFAEILDAIKGVNPSSAIGSADEIDTEGGSESDPENTKTCTIEGVGWIVCPAMMFVGGLNDAMFAIIKEFLTVEKGYISGDSGTFTAWKMFRDIANIVFVILFLVVIFSQLTSVGVSNYGIKKILPKMIIAVLLINMSFYICQAAVDLSNILGHSLRGLFESVGSDVIKLSEENSNGIGWGEKLGAILSGGLTTALVAGGGAFALYAIGIPGALMFLLSALMTLLILVGRQAGIILLVAISPVAFAAWLLPNTEGYFKKWWEMFFGLLLVFPIVSILFGAGALAASILNTSDDSAIQIAALVVSALPLIMTPSLLKNSMNALGGVSAKAAGLQNKLISQAAKSTKDNFGKKAPVQAWNSGRQMRQAKKAAQTRKSLHRGVSGGIGRLAAGGANASSWQARAQGEAANIEKKEDEEQVENAKAWIGGLQGVTTNDLAAGAITGRMRIRNSDGSHTEHTLTEHQQRAAMRMLAPKITGQQADQLAAATSGFSESLRHEASDAIAKEGAKKSPYLGGASLEKMRNGEFSMDDAVSTYNNSKIKAASLASADASSLERMLTSASSDSSGEQMKNLRQAYEDLKASSDLYGNVSAEAKAVLERIPSGSGGAGGAPDSPGGSSDAHDVAHEDDYIPAPHTSSDDSGY